MLRRKARAPAALRLRPCEAATPPLGVCVLGLGCEDQLVSSLGMCVFTPNQAAPGFLISSAVEADANPRWPNILRQTLGPCQEAHPDCCGDDSAPVRVTERLLLPSCVAQAVYSQKIFCGN